MFEHVGHANLPLYCRQLAELVRPGGLVMNHGITSRHIDGRPVSHGAGEFIDHYVFPHGELPHLTAISSCISESGLEIVDVESLRLHYARTLTEWLRRFDTNIDTVRETYDEYFVRAWRLYLAGCAAAFGASTIQLFQVVFAHPRHNTLALTREHLYRGRHGDDIDGSDIPAWDER